MATTNVAYLGKRPPKACLQVVYRGVPFLSGSGGGGTPVTPVPVVLPGGTTGLSYSETISAQGGTAPYTYAVFSGALPTGTSLNSASGLISGTASVAGIYSFVIKVTDAGLNTGTQSFSIAIAAPSASGGGAFTFLS